MAKRIDNNPVAKKKNSTKKAVTKVPLGPTMLTKRLVKVDGYGKQALRTGWVISEIHRRVLLESMAKQENPEDLHTARAVRSNFVQLLWFEALARYGDRQDEFEVLIDDKGRVIIEI